MNELKLSLSARRRAIACSTSPRSNRPKRGAVASSSSAAAGHRPLAHSRSSDSFACFEEETNEDAENECVNTASVAVAVTAAATAKQPLAAKANPSHRRTFAAAHAASKAAAATAPINSAANAASGISSSADPQLAEKFPLMASTALSAHLIARDNCSLRRAAIASPERPANEWQD